MYFSGTLGMIPQMNQRLALVDQGVVVDADDVPFGRGTYLSLKLSVGVHHRA